MVSGNAFNTTLCAPILDASHYLSKCQWPPSFLGVKSFLSKGLWWAWLQDGGLYKCCSTYEAGTPNFVCLNKDYYCWSILTCCKTDFEQTLHFVNLHAIGIMQKHEVKYPNILVQWTQIDKWKHWMVISNGHQSMSFWETFWKLSSPYALSYLACSWPQNHSALETCSMFRMKPWAQTTWSSCLCVSNVKTARAGTFADLGLGSSLKKCLADEVFQAPFYPWVISWHCIDLG